MKKIKAKLVKLLLWLISLGLLGVVVGLIVQSFFSSQLPLETKAMLNMVAENRELKERINNPQKYNDLPCIEVKFLEQDYCFNQSKVASFSAHRTIVDKQIKALSFVFFSDVLNKKGVSTSPIRVLMEKTESAGFPKNYVPRYVYSRRNNVEEKALYRERYEKLIQESEGKWFEYSELMQHQPPNYEFPNKRKFVFISEGKVVASMRYLSPTPYWQHSGTIKYKISNFPLVLEFLFVTKDQLVKPKILILNVAKEIEQYFVDSQINK